MRRRRVMLATAQGPRLPAEYQKVEYLYAAGGQCFQLPHIPQRGIHLKIEVQLSNNNALNALFYSIKSSDTTLQFAVLATVNRVSWYTDSYYKWFSAGNAYTFPQLGTNRHIIEVESNGNLILDGVTECSNPTYAGETDTPLLLLARQNNTQQYMQGNLYGFSCWYDDPTLFKAELVPCRRKSDNKPGMYDLAGSICPLTNSPFYINAGTGEFTVGPDVN